MDMIKDMFDDELEYSIKTSSYVKKNLTNTSTKMDRAELEILYKKCREHACNSIVSGLKNFDSMIAGGFYYLDCEKDSFSILVRVRTNYEEDTIEATSMKREFLSFSIMNEKNLSHFPGRVIYGYHTGIDSSMIGYICPRDADTSAYARTRLELSELPEELLDLDDLCAQALLEKTYCQISIKSKSQTGILLPNAVVSIDAPTRDDLLAARQRKLPILVLRRGSKTVMTARDVFFTPELSNPLYI